MVLNKAQHIIEEIEGVRCSVVEKGVEKERSDFLKKLLEINGYDVKVISNGDEGKLTVAVTDILFNPVLAVYGRYLKTSSGKKVTLAYWMQQSFNETESEVNYWNFKK